jgi:hypothetical protein
MDIQLPPARRANHILGLLLAHPVHFFAAIPLDAHNLAGTLTFCVHDYKQLCDLHARPASMKVHLELASLVWPLAVDEPLVFHVSWGVAKIERVYLRRREEDVPWRYEGFARKRFRGQGAGHDALSRVWRWWWGELAASRLAIACGGFAWFD